LNLRPTDYEFDPPLSPTSEIEPERAVDKRFLSSEQPNVSQCLAAVAGPMRDTSRAGLAERRESELLCIHTSERVRPNRRLLYGNDRWRSPYEGVVYRNSGRAWYSWTDHHNSLS
jgi:hypothetical protein